MTSRSDGTTGLRLRRAPALLTLAIMVASCGGGGGAEVATGTQGTTNTTGTAGGAGDTTVTSLPLSTTSPRGVGGTTTTAVTRADGIPTSTSPPSGVGGLGRRETPADGAPGQFAARIGAGPGPCYERRDRPKAVVPNHVVLGGQGTTGSVVHAVLCFEGFAADTPVDVRVDFPDGRTKNITVPNLTPKFADPEDSSRLHWYVQPGDPLGDYQVSATQRGERIKGSFRIQPVSGRYIYVLPPNLIPLAEGPPGTTVSVILLGFEPSAPVDFYVYRQLDPGGTFGFVSSSQARVDGAGQGRANLSTSPNDPPGTYCVILRERALSSRPGDNDTCAVVFPWPDLFTLAR